MATVTGLTAARMIEIEDASVVSGEVVGDDLILTTHGGDNINAGDVRGPQGDPGADAAPGDVNPTANTTPIRTSDGRVKGATPTATNDLTTKAYVDSGDSAAIATAAAYADTLNDSRTALKKVRMASTANLTLSGTQTIDGIAGAVGDRVLVKNQTTGSQNGIYVLASGSWTRATDADTAAEIAGVVVAVSDGTLYGGTRWGTKFKSSNTLGTTAMVWESNSPVMITITGTTDSVGLLTITHGLGFAPSAVFFMNTGPAGNFSMAWGVDTIGTTTFRVRFMNVNGGLYISASIGSYKALCYH